MSSERTRRIFLHIGIASRLHGDVWTPAAYSQGLHVLRSEGLRLVFLGAGSCSETSLWVILQLFVPTGGFIGTETARADFKRLLHRDGVTSSFGLVLV